MARRTDAIPSLDRGWGCGTVSGALLLDDDTIRGWFMMYREGGVAALGGFDARGPSRAPNAERLALLKGWATATLPAPAPRRRTAKDSVETGQGHSGGLVRRFTARSPHMQRILQPSSGSTFPQPAMTDKGPKLECEGEHAV